jgi:hypothetical protein
MRFLSIAALLCIFGLMASAIQASDSTGPAVTPEPNLVVLMGAALAGVGVVAWRRNRKP